MLDFRMESFLAVCKYMNFTWAAEELNLTQPAVSQHIKYLKTKYGVPLFIRDRKSLTLSPAGEILLCSLESLRTDENTMMKRMKDSLARKKILTFDVTMTIGEYAILPSLADFIKAHPDTDFHIHSSNTKTLLSDLCEGNIDFCHRGGIF